MKYYKFVKWEAADIEKVKAGQVPQAIEAAENGNYKPLKELYKNGMDVQNPVYKCGGWAFPFDHLLKKYWIKTRYYGIIEGYAPDKTSIYNSMGKYNVIKIVGV